MSSREVIPYENSDSTIRANGRRFQKYRNVAENRSKRIPYMVPKEYVEICSGIRRNSCGIHSSIVRSSRSTRSLRKSFEIFQRKNRSNRIIEFTTIPRDKMSLP